MGKVDCWNCNKNPCSNKLDEELLEQMLVDRSKQKISWTKEGNRVRGIKQRWNKIGRNIAGAMANLSHVLASDRDVPKDECRKAAWNGVVEALMAKHPGSQLPERVRSTTKRHFDSLPLSYAQAGFDTEQVFAHIRLIDQARSDPHNLPAVLVQDLPCGQIRNSNASDYSCSSSSPSSSASWEEEDSVDVSLTFASSCSVSKGAVLWAIKGAGIRVKQVQIFERKGLVLGILLLQCTREWIQQDKMQHLFRAAVKRSKIMRFTLGLYGSEGCNGQNELKSARNLNEGINMEEPSRPSQVKLHLPSSIKIRIHRQKGVLCLKNSPPHWLLDSSKLKICDEPYRGRTVRGLYCGNQVAVKRFYLPEGQDFIEAEFGTEVLTLTSCSHKNVLKFYGICFDPHHHVCLVSHFMSGGSLEDLIKKKDLNIRTVLRLAMDIAEGMKFLHEHGIIHRNLKASNIFVDSHGAAVIGGLQLANFFCARGQPMNIASTPPWMAPEVHRFDFEDIVVTPKADVYNFGIILWELATCQLLTASEDIDLSFKSLIGGHCLSPLQNLLQHCWMSNPLDRPDFPDILNVLEMTGKNLHKQDV